MLNDAVGFKWVYLVTGFTQGHGGISYHYKNPAGSKTLQCIKQ